MYALHLLYFVFITTLQKHFKFLDLDTEMLMKISVVSAVSLLEQLETIRLTYVHILYLLIYSYLHSYLFT
jgi:hypothetical protein